MYKDALAQEIKAACLIKGNFKLRSGKMSKIYFDKYRFEGDPKLMRAITEELQGLLPNSFDCFAGLELGGIPLATTLSLKTEKPCIFIRKLPKKYGTCNLIEGSYKYGEKALVVEDVITTGGQVCRSIGQIREQGIIVSDVICVIDRQQGGEKNLKKIGCSLKSVFNLVELMGYD